MSKRFGLDKYVTTLAAAIVFCATYLIVRRFTLQAGDDYEILAVTHKLSVFEYILNRWHTWSGRLPYEAILFTLIKLPLLYWHLLMSLAVMLIFLCIFAQNRLYHSYLDKRAPKWIAFNLLVAFISVPLYHILFDYSCDSKAIYPTVEYLCNFASVVFGWFCGSIIYFLPNAFLIIGIYGISYINIIQSSSNKIKLFILLLLTVMISFSEITAMTWIFLLFILAFRSFWVKDIRLLKSNLLLLSFALFVFIFMLFIPGNAARYLYEAHHASGFSEFNTIGIVGKLKLGLFYGLGILVNKSKYVLLVITIALTIKALLYKKYYKALIMLIYIGSFLAILCFNSFQFPLWLAFYAKFTNNMPFNQVHLNYFLLLFTLLFILYIFKEICLMHNSVANVVVSTMYLSSILISILAGFGPTVYASGIRLFFTASILIYMVMLYVVLDFIGTVLGKVRSL